MIEPVGAVTARFGEGPVWDTARGLLWWVDITGGRVLATDGREFPLGGEVAAVFPTADGALVVARDADLLVLDPDGSAPPRVLASAPVGPRMRLNDGGVDPRGALFVGTMHADRAPGTAALYRLRGDRLDPVHTGVTISNGLGWSPDGHTLYYVDTPSLRVDRFTADPATGDLTPAAPLVDLAAGPGRPDGLTVDAQGFVWVAMVAAGQLRRFAPDGALDRVVALPVSHPTSLAFGGADLDELYVTSARDPLDAAARDAQPLAGRLLRLDPGVRGLPTPPVRLNAQAPSPKNRST